MPTLTSKETCTGCAACMNACSKNAIHMVPHGRLGHLHPIVDSTICVECGLCQKVCPALNNVELHKAPHAYAGWAKSPEENKKSTSGGAATVFSRHIIRQGGVVYGSASQGIAVNHIRVNNEDNLEELRGSKYVQSTMGMQYKNVKSDLQKGLRVLFIGTPCQCAGLKAYLRKPYDNLLIVDLICHGTPSLKLLQDHVRTKVSDEREVVKISFRDGGNYELALVVKNAEVLYKSNLWKQRYHDAYYNTFILGYTFRESCNQCLYARPERCSDITIGDFWGLGKEKPFHPLAKAYGYSVILPNTKKGLEFLKNINDDFYLQERSIDEAVNGNDQLRAPKSLTINAHIFQWFFTRGCSLKTALFLADWYKILAYKILNIIRNR